MLILYYVTSIGGNTVKYVDPIKDIEMIQTIKEILRKQSERDLLLFVFGINTGIRIHDLLNLKVEDVWDGEKVKEFLFIKEEHSEKTKAFYLNSKIEAVLTNYIKSNDMKAHEYLFRSKRDHMPISRQQAYRIINKAAKKAGTKGRIGMHTLRKTFGYHAYRKGIAISILMDIFNHHSRTETLKYIGVEKGKENFIRVDVNL